MCAISQLFAIQLLSVLDWHRSRLVARDIKAGSRLTVGCDFRKFHHLPSRETNLPRHNAFKMLLLALPFPVFFSRWSIPPNPARGPVSRNSRNVFGPEKPLVKLRPAYSVKLVFLYFVKGIKIKITAKFRASKRLCFEDTNRISRPEMRPKSFGTFEKQAPGLRRNRPLNFETFMLYKLDGCSKCICSHFQDEGETTRAKEVTLEAMSFAASEVDGSGTVDRSSSAAERLKQNTDETSRTVQDGGDDKQVFLTDIV